MLFANDSFFSCVSLHPRRLHSPISWVEGVSRGRGPRSHAVLNRHQQHDGGAQVDHQRDPGVQVLRGTRRPLQGQPDERQRRARLLQYHRNHREECERRIAGDPECNSRSLHCVGPPSSSAIIDQKAITFGLLDVVYILAIDLSMHKTSVRSKRLSCTFHLQKTKKEKKLPENILEGKPLSTRKTFHDPVT